MKGQALYRKSFAMNGAESISMSPAIFDQREKHRRSLFSRTWGELIPKVFEDVPKYYRLGNIVASWGLWEFWVWQFVRTIELKPGYRALDVCAGTNDIGIRLLRKQPEHFRHGDRPQQGDAARRPEPRPEIWRSYRERDPRRA